MPKILVVDDSASTRATVEVILAGAGHQVHTCSGGREALQMLEKDTFDLLLTDIFMPDEDGLQLIRESRRRCPDLPIIAMSGVTGPMDMLGVAKILGASRILKKPFGEGDLLPLVAKTIGSRRRDA